MRMTRAGAALAGAGLLLAAGCGSSSDNNAKASPTPAGPLTYQLQADVNRADLNLPAPEFVTSFYPKDLSVHPGDTVSISVNDSGEPHTLALGTLIDAAAVPYAKLTPKQKEGELPKALDAAFKKIPELLPQGPGDAIQAGAQPCFQATGLPSTKAACAVKTGEFSGSEALVGSGWLDPNAAFSLKISDAATPGTYNFFCQLHGPDMGGTLTVAAKATTIPTPEAAKAIGDAAITADTGQLTAAAAQLATGTAKSAFAGTFNPDFEPGGVAGFGPSNIKVPVGGKVTWKVIGPHTIYFNAPTDAQGLRQAAPDGAVHLNEKAFAPVGGPPPPEKAGLVNGGSWNGVGPHSSGFFLSFPPDLYSYSLTFTKAGTFNYLCTVHPGMKGTVTVG